MTDDEMDEILEQFFFKTDYDFRTVEGWKEFLNERNPHSADRMADGAQMRDFKPYSVGSAFIASHGAPIPVHINIRTQGQGLGLPPGILSVYYPDENWNFHVRNEVIGPPSKTSCDFHFTVAGGDSLERPGWGSFYYIAQTINQIPSTAKFAANQLNKKIVDKLLKNTSKIVRKGTKLLRFGGAFYIVTVYVGGQVYRSSFCGGGWPERSSDSGCYPQNELGEGWLHELQKVKDALLRKSSHLLE